MLQVLHCNLTHNHINGHRPRRANYHFYQIVLMKQIQKAISHAFLVAAVLFVNHAPFSLAISHTPSPHNILPGHVELKHDKI